MFGSIIAIFGTIKALLTMAALGAGVGGLSWLAARLIPGFTGLIAACVLGGAVVIGSGGAGFMTATSNCANEAKLNELRFEKARLQQELDAERALAAVQDEVLADVQKVSDDNEMVLSRLADLAATLDDSACLITAEELEAINEIR